MPSKLPWSCIKFDYSNMGQWECLTDWCEPRPPLLLMNARHSVGIMIIHFSFAPHNQHSPVNYTSQNWNRFATKKCANQKPRHLRIVLITYLHVGRRASSNTIQPARIFFMLPAPPRTCQHVKGSILKGFANSKL